MGILFAIIGALIVGVLARYFYPGEVKLSLLYSILLGFLGGLLGKGVSFLFGLGFTGGIVTSVLGAIAVIAIYKYYLTKAVEASVKKTISKKKK